MLSVTEKINKLLDSFNNGSGKGNNFMPKGLYDYLNNMSLLEEAYLLHILLFLVLMLTVFNILVALFSNEIIKYFNLEEKYPSLYAFFKLRIKFKRYYLIWNISILFIICLGGIGINILAIYCLN
uniref:LAGLIDADG endonuclease n=1 Tax=Metarhizium rileyi (strain RCEF 4871) TaxID=1649241 RepID=A0A6H0B8J8_METRR|nr:hypothetical protein [Metarhizium rileyi]QIS49082.1 hypothetical protein [Metarhizium rileyi]